jgi:hypothetical protein
MTAPTLSFRVQGLEGRDETLFKSFVRLIAHRTNHHWVPADRDADVAVVPAAAFTAARPGHVLVVGAAAGHPQHSLGLPFRAVLSARGHHAPGGGSLPARMRLVRWPAMNLLRDPERLRLATLMTGRFMTLAQMHQASGAKLEACEAFAHDLLREGLLAGGDHGPASVPAPLAPLAPRQRVAADAGLLAQIRSRLRRVSLAFK